jgi:hypothetical protein
VCLRGNNKVVTDFFPAHLSPNNLLWLAPPERLGWDAVSQLAPIAGAWPVLSWRADADGTIGSVNLDFDVVYIGGASIGGRRSWAVLW